MKRRDLLFVGIVIVASVLILLIILSSEEPAAVSATPTIEVNAVPTVVPSAEPSEAAPTAAVNEILYETPNVSMTIPIPFDAGKKLSDNEFYVLNGITLGMSYEEALPYLALYERSTFDSVISKGVTIDGYFLWFYTKDGSASHAYVDGELVEVSPDPNRDNTCYLVSIDIKNSCADDLIRGIRIGDSIESVLEKFPSRDTKLKKWEIQMLYGEVADTDQYAALRFTTILGRYDIVAVSTKCGLTIDFDKQNNVERLSLFRYSIR